MLRWRIRSALYIDFENVPLPPDAIANWLAWLEDGAFDAAGQRRRFLQKRVYWNSHAERNRALFQKHGFAPILIGKYSGLKNGADIRMAMDVVEATYTRSEIDEFILLTGDSDFVPVLERLREKAKRSAIVATEHRPNIHTTYHRSADILIPSRRLTEAAHYKRPRRGLLSRMLGRPQAETPVAAAANGRIAHEGAGPPLRGSPPSRPQRKIAAPPASLDPAPVLDTAAKHVLKLLTRQPRNYVAQKRVVAELEQLESFKRQGPTAFLGTGSYKNLLKELTRLEPRITVVDQPGGGTGIVFIPPPPELDAASVETGSHGDSGAAPPEQSPEAPMPQEPAPERDPSIVSEPTIEPQAHRPASFPALTGLSDQPPMAASTSSSRSAAAPQDA